MIKFRFSTLLLSSIFIINSPLLCVPDISVSFVLNSRDLFPFLVTKNQNLTAQEKNDLIQYFYGYDDGYNNGFNTAAIIGTVFAGVCAVWGIIVGTKITQHFAVKEESENKKVKHIMILHTFIQDILYACKDLCERQTQIENSLLRYYLLNNDNLHVFLNENDITSWEMHGAGLFTFMDNVRALTNLYINNNYIALHSRPIFIAKQNLLDSINRLYEGFNKELKELNQLTVTLNDDLSNFLLD